MTTFDWPSGDEREDIPPSTVLMAQVMSANAAATAWAVQAVEDGLRRDLARARAEIMLIRDRLEAICSGDYAPSTAAIMRAAYPSPYVIDRVAMEDLRARAERL